MIRISPPTPFTPLQASWLAVSFRTWRDELVKCIVEAVMSCCTPAQRDRLERAATAIAQCEWLNPTAMNEIESVFDELFDLHRIWSERPYLWEPTISNQASISIFLLPQEAKDLEEELEALKDMMAALPCHIGASLIYVGDSTGGVALVQTAEAVRQGKSNFGDLGNVLRQIAEFHFPFLQSGRDQQ